MHKKFVFVLFTCFVLLLIAVFTFPGVCFPGFCYSSSNANNSYIRGAISQARVIMVAVSLQENNYDNFNCNYEGMSSLCKEIDIHYGQEDRKEPTVSHDATKNSKAVCIYAPLNARKRWFHKEEESFWYCADSEGRVGYSTIDPGGAGHCIDGQSAICPSLVEDRVSESQQQDKIGDFNISDFSVIPFETCGIQTAPNVIKSQAREIEEEAKFMTGYANHTICKINIDDDTSTEEYIMESAAPGRNVTFFVYKMVEGEWKIVLETSASVAYIPKEKNDGFSDILFSGSVSAAERYWELYEWSDVLREYKAVREWVENY